jgi:hypothetical protein
VHKKLKVAIAAAIAAAAVANYFVIQAVLMIPCDSQESCSQRLAGLLIVAGSDIFTIVIVVSELGKRGHHKG